ncbi:MAG: hypothetical protein LM590_09005 [Thermofilum sp.]|nr:hypothetical protein [Thermofilum sp.]
MTSPLARGRGLKEFELGFLEAILIVERGSRCDRSLDTQSAINAGGLLQEAAGEREHA